MSGSIVFAAMLFLQSGWMVSESKNRMDSKPEVTLRKAGDVSGSGLNIRCKDGETDVYVATDDIVDGPSVRLKFDSESAVREKWVRSTSYKGLFVGDDPIGLAKKLAASNKFLFEYTPFQHGPRIIEFDLAGLQSLLPKVSAACNWDAHYQAAARETNLRSIFEPFAFQCKERRNSGKWCWIDPEDSFYRNERTGYDTKAQAIDAAINVAKSGTAFKNLQGALNSPPER